MKLKILSWNIWQGKHLSEIIEFLKNAKADVIALQEVIVKDDKNTAEVIAKELGYVYAYYPAVEQNYFGCQQGNAIVSRYPITEQKVHILSNESLYVNTAETEPRIAVETTLLVDDINIKVFSVHLAYSHEFQPSHMRELQVDNLLKVLPKTSAILMGDFNSHPDNPIIGKLDTMMKNADLKLTEPTWTIYPFEYQGFRETELRHRLDYIFTTPNMHAEDFRVEHSKGSDHLPISATIEVN
jgi:endonuclease/exonuclease/phosphatase family metal-dependent hydrolase